MVLVVLVGLVVGAAAVLAVVRAYGWCMVWEMSAQGGSDCSDGRGPKGSRLSVTPKTCGLRRRFVVGHGIQRERARAYPQLTVETWSLKQMLELALLLSLFSLLLV